MELLELAPGVRAVSGEAALLLEGPGGQRTLVVADLHIGWESALADKGFHIPSQVGKMLARIERLVKALRPGELLFLGDVKHTIVGAEAEEWAAIPTFFKKLMGLVGRIRVVPGNHDGKLEALLPDGVELLSTGGIAIGRFGLFHGHAWPGPSLLECECLISGHMHPVVLLREAPYFRTTKRVWLVMECDGHRLASEMGKRGRLGPAPGHVGVSKLIIMPSFNEFLGGQALNSRRREEGLIGPILRCGCAQLSSAEVFMLDGTFLGTVSQLGKGLL